MITMQASCADCSKDEYTTVNDVTLYRDGTTEVANFIDPHGSTEVDILSFEDKCNKCGGELVYSFYKHDTFKINKVCTADTEPNETCRICTLLFCCPKLATHINNI